MLNERELQGNIVKFLKSIGCPIVKEDVKIRKGNKVLRPDIVGYTINEEGNLIPKVVVEVKMKPIPDAQQQLMDYSKAMEAPYGLLVIGSNYYWFDSTTSLPVEAQEFRSSLFVKSGEDIRNILFECLNRMRGHLSDNGIIWTIAYSLLIRTYLQKQDRLNIWNNVTSEQDYLDIAKEAQIFFSIKIEELVLRNISLVLPHVVDSLSSLPPISKALGESMLSLISKEGRKEVIGQYVTPEPVRNLIRILIDALKINGEEAIDLATGYGGLIYNIYNILQVKSFVGVEIVNQVAEMAQIIGIISGYENVRILCDDSLQGEANELHKNDHYVLSVVDGPFGGKREDLRQFVITQNGKRSRVDMTEVFIEKAIRLTKPEGHIIAVVPEGILFSGPSRITREFIKENTIIEAIISLPAHTFRPYSGLKTSVLVLRKKSAPNDTAVELFLGNPESIDDFNKIAYEFSKWRNGGNQF